MIIATVSGPGMKEVFAQARAAAPYARLLEYRLDLMDRPVVRTILAFTPRPAIITFRPSREGGEYTGPEEDRLAALEGAAAEGAPYIDMEYDVPRAEWRRLREKYPRTTFIGSHHILRPGAVSVPSVYRALAATGADIVKFAFSARDACDLRHVRDFLALAARHRHRAVCLAMGEMGEASRILYRVWGGWGTYGSAPGARAAAPGQIPVRELATVYRAHKLTPRTRVFGVVGMPLGQSKGMYMHNAAFGNPRAVYCRFPVAQLKPFVRHIVPMLHGFSVTLPHKEKIMQYVDRVDSTTRAIGAVNTVVRRGGQLVGTNTDAPGALDAIERTGSVQGKTVLIVGAGGAARAVAYEAVRRGARVLIANRHMARARRLALEVGALAIPVAKIPRAEFDILANTTPAGMTPDVTAIPVPPSTLGGKIVFDAVYNPPLTRLLREARARGSRIVPGTAMYVNQAAEQSRLYTGRRPSKALLRRALERHLKPLPQ